MSSNNEKKLIAYAGKLAGMTKQRLIVECLRCASKGMSLNDELKELKLETTEVIEEEEKLSTIWECVRDLRADPRKSIAEMASKIDLDGGGAIHMKTLMQRAFGVSGKKVITKWVKKGKKTTKKQFLANAYPAEEAKNVVIGYFFMLT